MSAISATIFDFSKKNIKQNYAQIVLNLVENMDLQPQI